MVHTNKVLTVSYGTFSCTLEGFEDSFDTMKAIAEYFRDLAADDRYFGAEPPQPDVDMLARIAQREISRRVEAHSDASGIVLRAREPAPMVAAAPKPAPAPTAPAQTAPARFDAELDAEFDQNAGKEAMTKSTPVDAADVDAPGVVAPRDAPIDPVADAAPIAEAVETQATPAAPPQAPDKAARSPAITDAGPESTPDTAPEIIPQPAPDIIPAADSIAAKLQRIRAVVSRSSHAAVKPGDAANEPFEPFLTAVQDMTDSLSVDDEYEEEYGPEYTGEYRGGDNAGYEDETTEGDDLALTLSGFELDSDADAHAPDPAQDDSGEAAAFAGLDDPETDLDGPETAADPDLANILNSGADDSAAKPAIPEGTRVAKVRRTELEDAIGRGAIQELGAEIAPDSSLPPDQEADLMRELAEVEAELRPAGDGDDSDDSVDAARMEQHGADDDVSRLMQAADQKMDEPDSATRRDAYSHLRAAVAATQAERLITGEVPQLTHDRDYRNDLANVVRPRRPAPAGAAGQRPSDNRQAPLKLVAEQRVDDAAGNTRRGPVRPRRVSPADVEESLAGEVAGGSGRFADFAREAGATGLSELLEAAAAYMSYVEGRDQFSRPQLMSKVRQVEQEEFNREEGLRSFGQLLREGKIRKTKGGRFTASEDIGFKPAQRAAG